MRDGRISAAAPWSFFAPVTLAVLVGAVVAGLILRGIDAASDAGEHAPVAGPVPVPDSEPASGEAAPPPGTGNAPSAVADSPQFPTPTAPASPAKQAERAAPPPSLPGAIVARRDGDPAACINGTVALRDENGWRQQLENNVPVPCVEAAAPAP